MPQQPTRRHFLQAAATSGAVLSLGDWSAFSPLSPATGQSSPVAFLTDE
jgi:hypothetical protein